MSKKIIFYAPVGKGLPQHLLGGGEKGCRRTREILLNAGYEVVTVDKPNMGHGGMNYIKTAVKSYLKVMHNLISDKNSILYVVGFYEKNIHMEFLNVFFGKLLHHKVIYEARNGRLLKAYEEYGRLYKRLMGYILKKVDLLFVQGLEYVDFIKEVFHKKAIYTPNYVMNRSLRTYDADRPFDIIRLLYFGRVSESKNINVVIQTASELEKKGYKTSTVIIGGYLEEYKQTLNQLVKLLNLNPETVELMGQQSFEVISEKAQKAHFFLFPSQEKMEGHSNSLTEAMTFGVVPIVSTAGFNANICGKPELVVEPLKAEAYADVIEKILIEGRWAELSQYVYQRIKENYTEDRVRESILEAISEL